MDGLIIEGVAGTGKSTIVSLLNANLELHRRKRNIEVIDEDKTTGELVTELRDSSLTDEDRYHRLRNLIPLIKGRNKLGDFTILERFHPTYYALMPDSSFFEFYDNVLSELNFGLVLLDLPDDAFLSRSFFRPEMEGQNWSTGLRDWYGSQEAAVNAFIISQQRRRDFLQKTKLKNLRLDTSEKNWASYVTSILKFLAL